MKKTSLRAWLRRDPAPASVKVRLEDGEMLTITIPADIRNRWKTVETSINSSNAVAVMLFDKKGELLRSQDVEADDKEEEDDSPEGKYQALQSKNMKDLAGIVAAVMHEQNVSFDKGKDAASQSQESLVNLVDTMAQHFAAALTNVHNIVANMAAMQQSHAEAQAKLTAQVASLQGEGGGGDAMGQTLMGLIAQAAMSPKQAPAPPPPANGNGKGK